jgi:hypothetical protein
MTFAGLHNTMSQKIELFIVRMLENYVLRRIFGSKKEVDLGL